MGGWAVHIATIVFWAMFVWVAFLIYDYQTRAYKPSLVVSVLLVGHMWLAILLLAAANLTSYYQDTNLVWFAFLVVFRYHRIVINVFFWFTYKPAVAPDGFNLSPSDVTVIVPSVGPNDIKVFTEMVCGILYNQPSRLIFSVISDEVVNAINDALPPILESLANGTSLYQQERGLACLEIKTDIKCFSTNIANKREQTCRPLHLVETSLVASADDTAIWNPKFLKATLPAFAKDKVGLVGTRKWVKHLPRPAPDPSLSWLTNKWNSYQLGFWNAQGATYLIRHNFEARATNSADGGVFTISGRTLFVRSHILMDKAFQAAFLNEWICLFGKKMWGPVVADDDTFLMRWVMNHGWDIKFQYSDDATITTLLGNMGTKKFKDQCLRWSRTTFRQNPQILFVDRIVWWKHPLTVWTTFLPWCYNAALVWDTLLIVTLYMSQFYKESNHRVAMMAGFVGFVWLTKLIKRAPWFWKHPGDFFMYFFPIPVFALFVYVHSVLKIWTAITFYNLEWSGRKLPPVSELQPESGVKKE